MIPLVSIAIHGIWTIGEAKQTCSDRPDQPETRKTGSIQAGPVLFDIPHLINTCININIYMTICILIVRLSLLRKTMLYPEY